MALPRYRANNTPSPSGSTGTSTGSTAPTSSPAPASSGGTPTNSKSSKNSGNSGILLGISGGLLIARMFFFGGALWLLEIIAIVITAGVAHSKGGKGQKVTAKIIMGLAVLNLFIPGFNSWVKGIRDNQLNPSPPEQSARQQEQLGSSSPTPTPEAPIARERIAQIPGKVIVLTKSKTITLPPGQKDICFSWLGDSTGRWNQSLEIGNQTFSTQGSDCFPVTQEGSVEVKFINPTQTEVDTYQFAKNQKEGQGEYPFIKLPK